MKKRQNNSVGASVFQIALCVVLICSSILFASSFRAAPQAAFDGFYPPLPNANQQSGFYPALPNNAPNGTCPSLPISVALPVAFIGPSPSGVVLMPVTTTFIDSTIPPGDPSGSVGFQGDFTFDSSVITFLTVSPGPTQAAGLTAVNWNVSGNVLNTGPGTLKTLRISAFSNDFTPLSGGPDTLFYLRVQAQTSTFGSSSSTPLTWAPLCGGNEFVFIDCTLTSYDPRQQNNGLVAIQGPGVNIAGTITYCSNPVSGPVPNVTLTLTGGASGSTSSDSSGNYLFLGLPSGGTYAVTPSKAQLLPGAANINTVDVIAIQRHFLNLGTPLSGCQLTAADVNGDGQVNTVDVTAIVRFYLGQSTGIGNTGRYKFIPISRTYTGVLTNQTAQNYDALVFGDVASPYVH